MDRDELSSTRPRNGTHPPLLWSTLGGTTGTMVLKTGSPSCLIGGRCGDSSPHLESRDASHTSHSRTSRSRRVWTPPSGRHFFAGQADQPYSPNVDAF